MGLLDGKVAIVTGAGHGIGRGEALELAAEGAKVVVNDMGGSVTGEGADKRPAEEVAELLRSRGAEAVANYDDVADWKGAENLIQQAVEAFGRLDIVVNNAGIIRDKMIFSMTEDDFDSVVRVHLKGTFATTHHASVYWRNESKEGRQPRAAVVNTVSSAGLVGNLGQANYGSAKAAIAALTIVTSLDMARYGVRANAVAPGGVTRMSAGVIKDLEVKEADEYPDGEFARLNPGNSAPMVAWLASDEAMHVTGQVFRAVGASIAHYKPWSLGAEITTPKEPAKWKPENIGAAVNAHIFGSRNPGLQIGG
ncbi:MAG: SDR family oxidoreductase [Actinobacteria bacterium]|nr:SDR family oxidoreductase [Actinomycetota bacterium]MBV8958572.1 SDR family oxidoreductase [Actinomycetota bacterium]MBV9666271.1 SDR family oxidoreductase [Actinomycetota bacterium]MBV9935554.1 SDR family oxidoreductase [Actinomycetota bacterium]